MKLTYDQRVVTWQSPGGYKMSLCSEHGREHDRTPYRDPNGQEFCQVSHGQHSGLCDVCISIELEED